MKGDVDYLHGVPSQVPDKGATWLKLYAVSRAKNKKDWESAIGEAFEEGTRIQVWFYNNSPKVLKAAKSLAHSGIPHQLRPTVWEIACGAKVLRFKNPDYYKECGIMITQRGSCQAYLEIEQAAGAAIVHYPQLCQDQAKITKLLKVTNFRRPNVELNRQVAGMASALLALCSEEMSFWILNNFLGLLFPDEANTDVHVEVSALILQQLLTKYVPDVRLSEEQLKRVVSVWFSSLFLHLPREVAFRIWDLISVQEKVHHLLLSISISIFELHRSSLIPQLLSPNLQDVLCNLGSTFHDADVLINSALSRLSAVNSLCNKAEGKLLEERMAKKLHRISSKHQDLNRSSMDASRISRTSISSNALSSLDKEPEAKGDGRSSRNSMAEESKRPEAEATKFWICATCTKKNPLSAPTCAVCSSPQIGGATPSSSPSAASSASAANRQLLAVPGSASIDHHSPNAVVFHTAAATIPCQHCGFQLPSSAKFCSECGSVPTKQAQSNAQEWICRNCTKRNGLGIERCTVCFALNPVLLSSLVTPSPTPPVESQAPVVQKLDENKGEPKNAQMEAKQNGPAVVFHATKTCTSCNSVIPTFARFCGTCGAVFQDAPQMTAAPVIADSVPQCTVNSSAGIAPSSAMPTIPELEPPRRASVNSLVPGPADLPPSIEPIVAVQEPCASKSLIQSSAPHLENSDEKDQSVPAQKNIEIDLNYQIYDTLDPRNEKEESKTTFVEPPNPRDVPEFFNPSNSQSMATFVDPPKHNISTFVTPPPNPQISSAFTVPRNGLSSRSSFDASSSQPTFDYTERTPALNTQSQSSFDQPRRSSLEPQSQPNPQTSLNQPQPQLSLSQPQSQPLVDQSQFTYPQSQPSLSYPQSQPSLNPQNQSTRRNSQSESQPQSQPSYPQSQPQSQPSYPQSQPQIIQPPSYPQSQPSYPQSQPSYPQSQPSYPQSQPSYPQSQPSTNYPQSKPSFTPGPESFSYPQSQASSQPYTQSQSSHYPESSAQSAFSGAGSYPMSKAKDPQPQPIKQPQPTAPTQSSAPAPPTPQVLRQMKNDAIQLIAKASKKEQDAKKQEALMKSGKVQYQESKDLYIQGIRLLLQCAPHEPEATRGTLKQQISGYLQRVEDIKILLDLLN